MHTISAPWRATGLNENYARELLELHTLSFGGGYTQDDLVAVSPAFTGWTIDLRSGHFTFEPEAHDASPKVVLGWEITTPEFFSREAYRDQSKDTVQMMYSEWPGLEPEQLYEGRDLALTTDFRDIFAEALAGQLGIEQLDRVFPGYQVDRTKLHGLIG